MVLPGGSKQEYAYDALMRITSITAFNPGQNVVMSRAYDYDPMDNITTKATEHGAYEYGYDALYRLTSAVNPTQDDESYTYDGVGNRLTSAEHADWQYNENNELLGYNGVSFAYDANGNTVRKTEGSQETVYVYNLENRLERVEDGSGTVIGEYYYDPFGRRLWKDVGGTRTCFHYADEGLVGEFDATGTILKTYGYRPNSTWTTNPLFMKVGSAYYFYHNDHLGTPQKLTSVSGAVVWSGEYASFGEVTVSAASSVVNNLRFPGQYFDGESGEHYNYHRYYKPGIGRYINADPIRFMGGVNFFTYSEMNPINYSDFRGLIEDCTAWFPTFSVKWYPTGEKTPVQKQVYLSYFLISTLDKTGVTTAYQLMEYFYQVEEESYRKYYRFCIYICSSDINFNIEEAWLLTDKTRWRIVHLKAKWELIEDPTLPPREL